MNEFSPRPELPSPSDPTDYEPAQRDIEFRFEPNDSESGVTDRAVVYDAGLGAGGENPMAVVSSGDGYSASEIADPVVASDAHTGQAKTEITDQPNDDTEGLDKDDLFKQMIQEAFGEAADNQEIAPDLVFPGAGTPPSVPPSDNHDLGSGELPERPEESDGKLKPTLGVGEIIEYTLTDSGYTAITPNDNEPVIVVSISDRIDKIVAKTEEFQEYDGEIDRRTIDVASDTTVIARGSDEHPITLAARARDGLVITFQHSATGEGAITSINSSTADAYQQVELVQSVLHAAGALSSDGVVVHVFGGNQEQVTGDGVTMSYAEGMASYLRDIEMLPNVTVVYDVQGEIEVTMSVHSGAPKARVGGVVVYPYSEEDNPR